MLCSLSSRPKEDGSLVHCHPLAGGVRKLRLACGVEQQVWEGFPLDETPQLHENPGDHIEPDSQLIDHKAGGADHPDDYGQLLGHEGLYHRVGHQW